MHDCSACKEERLNTQPVPYIVHEAALARLERTVKRLWILALVAVALLVATNGAWIWYESQMESISLEQEVETGEGDAYVNGVGDFTYGESPSED